MGIEKEEGQKKIRKKENYINKNRRDNNMYVYVYEQMKKLYQER